MTRSASTPRIVRLPSTVAISITVSGNWLNVRARERRLLIAITDLLDVYEQERDAETAILTPLGTATAAEEQLP